MNCRKRLKEKEDETITSLFIKLRIELYLTPNHYHL